MFAVDPKDYTSGWLRSWENVLLKTPLHILLRKNIKVALALHAVCSQ